MRGIEAPQAPNVPIDYSALLCRRPSSEIEPPKQPGRLDFLHRILKENEQKRDEEDDGPSELVASTHTLESVSARDRGDASLIPPENFAMVNSWLYRSSFPKKKHFPFLKTLGLRSVLTLILEDYPEQNIQFLDENGITFFQFGIPGNKEPFVQSMSSPSYPVPEETVTAALATILDQRNHPILIHCNKGKHRTGCVIGCLRKLQQWSLTTIFDEYRRFSYPKARSMDQEFIELYRESAVWPEIDPKYLPDWAVLVKGELSRPCVLQEEKDEDSDMRGM